MHCAVSIFSSSFASDCLLQFWGPRLGLAGSGPRDKDGNMECGNKGTQELPDWLRRVIHILQYLVSGSGQKYRMPQRKVQETLQLIDEIICLSRRSLPRL